MKLTKAREATLTQALSKLKPEDLVFIYDKLTPKMSRIREQARERALQHFRQRARTVRFRPAGDTANAL